MTTPDSIEHPLVISRSSLNEDSLFLLMYSLPGCGRSYLTCWVLCPVFVSAPQNNSLRCPDETPRFVEYFSFLPLLWSVECFVHAMTSLDVDLCVDNLSPALCKTTRHRKLLWQTSASECFLEWRLCFSKEKVFLSRCSPRASCFSEWRAGGSFEAQFRSTSFRC